MLPSWLSKFASSPLPARRTLALVLAWWVSGWPARAQPLERLTVDDGLSQGFVRSVVQTRDGFLWVATLDGLNRYDGTEFKVYRHDPADPYSLDSDFVMELMEDSRGILWVMTDRGPNLFDPLANRFYHPDVVGQRYSVNNVNPLRCFREDRLGRVWTIYEGEIIRFEIPAGLTPEAAAGSMRMRTGFFPKNSLGLVYHLTPLDTALWFICEKGYFSLSFADEALRPLPFPPNIDIAYIWQDTFSGTIWMQGAHGVSRLSAGRLYTFVPEAYDMGRTPGWSGPKCTYFFSKNKVHRWQNGVCSTLDGQTPELILSAVEDRTGVVWLGTNAHGLYKMPAGRTQFGRFQEGRSQVRPPVEDVQGNLWVYESQWGRSGYYRYDFVLGRMGERLHTLPQHYLASSRNGGFWFLSDGSVLYRLGQAGGNARNCSIAGPPDVYAVHLIEDSRGRAGCVLSDAQIAFFDPRTEKWSAWSFAHLFDPARIPTFSSFTEDAGGRFWIGTADGLVEATPEDGGRNYRFKRYGSADGLSRSRVLSLLADPSDPQCLWVGTQHGLNRLDAATGEIASLTLRDGLPNDVIYSILPANDSTLWLGTNSGLLRFNHRSRRWQHFTKNDGLPGSEFNTGVALRLRDGRLLFGGVGGLVVFEPEQFTVSPDRPGIAFTDVLVNARPYPGPVNPAVPIRLSAEENYISVRFALLDYVNPASNRYQYRLLGANEAWTPPDGANSVTLSNMRPGHYQLEVRGINSEGVESRVARLVFVISPPWWRSMWAFAGYGLLFFTAAWLLSRWRGRQRRFREMLAAEHREAERLKELDRFKSRLYTNITHEFRTPLTVILGVTKQLEQGRAPADPEQLGLILRNGEQLLRLVNQMLDWSKLENSSLRLQPKQFDAAAFLHMAAEPFAALAAAKGLELKYCFPEGALRIEADPDRLNDIVSNLLSNAVKFTPPGGTVALGLDIMPENILRITVEDTGIGIPPEHLERIFDRFYQILAPGSATGGTGIGLAYAQELAQYMGGSIAAHSIPGKGTRMELTLPQNARLLLTPRTAADEAARTPRRPSGPPAADGPARAELPLVLLVEDNADVAHYTAGCLAGRFTVEWVADGADGLAQAAELMPDLVLSDVMLPGLDGFALCAALKRDPRTDHIPVVLLTARADRDSRLQGLQHGASAYLVKPFLQEELLFKLDNLLRLRAAIQTHHTALFHQGLSADNAAESSATTPRDPFVQRVFDLIAAHYADPDFSVARLQQAVHLSSAQLQRKMLALTGKPPGHFLRLRRLEQSRQILLESPRATVADVASRVGYRDGNYFSRAFVQEYGLTPGAFRKQQT